MRGDHSTINIRFGFDRRDDSSDRVNRIGLLLCACLFAAWWTLCCVCVGFSIASVVFYLRQGLLAASVERERASLAALQQTHAALSAAYDRLRNVAASVCVPLPLDQFVEKAGANAEQLSDIVYKPRQILAHRGQRSE